MPDITYKKFSELDETSSLANNDLFPIAQYISPGVYNSKAVTFSTVNNQVSGALITPFTTSIQSSVNSTLSSDKWNSTYTTVRANSATWGATVNDTLTAFSQGNITSPQITRFLSAGTTANASVAFIATGTGATLAQLPDNGTGGGNARGSFATDWQKARNDAAQVASGVYSVIGGGERNKATTSYSAVGGGWTNSIIDTSTYASIGGGLLNTLSGDAVYGVIAGGYNNTCSKSSASILGGQSNRALSSYASVIGGYDNTASGNSSIAGGYGNTASGDNSTAIGTANNTNNKTNSHIIGSNMTAPSANFTYVNNISSQGDIRGANFYGPNIIKAWVTFDGSGTIGVACNILGSYNVSGVSKDASGEFTIAFTTPLANSYYAVAGSASSSSEVTVMVDSGTAGGSPTLKTTQYLKIIVRSNTTTASNSEQIMVMVVGL